MDDSNLFSVEESERIFSQFDEEPVELEPSRQTNLSTPVVPVLDNDLVTSPAPEGQPRLVATIQLLLYMIWMDPPFAVSRRVVPVDHVYKHTAGRYLMEPRLLGLLVVILTIYANGGAYAVQYKCEANMTYCGRTLMEPGWNEPDSDTIYLCESGGKNTTTLVRCSDSCVQGHHAKCSCHPGHAYCGHELYEEMNWWRSESYNVISPWLQMLGHCTNGSHMEWTSNCTTGCITQENGSYCACEVNKTYCGHRLPAMGLVGYDNNSLYICYSRGRVSRLQSCPQGCGYSSCLCQPGYTYCGSELVGWTKFSNDTLFQCKDEKTIEPVEQCAKGECRVRPRTDSYCLCTLGQTYCGHELYSRYNSEDTYLYSHNIYQCSASKLLVKVVDRCGTCVSIGGTPRCQAKCVVNRYYCGSEMLSLEGWKGTSLEPNGLYTCANETTTSLVRNCTAGCQLSSRTDSYCLCTPGQTYCGYELYTHYNSEDTYLYSHNIYQCSASKLLVKVVDRCGTCVSVGGTPRCQAKCSVPGWQYCGREVYSSDWQGYGETHQLPPEFSNDTLFRCKDEETIEPVEQCAKGECQVSPLTGKAYCLCTPGQTYCGHELHRRYNSEDTYLSSHNIYQCSGSKLLVKVVGSCGTCVSIGGTPRCQAECLVNRYYCGNKLLSLEGWKDTGLQPNGLYTCANGTTALLVQSCTAGCQLDDEDSDAYCSGEPPPWYWIFLGTVLLIIVIYLLIIFVIYLLSLLFRTYIKHRSLKRIIWRHRIDACQLTKVQKIRARKFGEVWKGKYSLSRHSMVDVALKVWKHQLGPEGVQALRSANCLFREVVAHQGSLNLEHKNIIKMYGVCSNLEGGTESALVLEYLNGGSSIDYVRSEQKRLMSGDLSRIFIDICQACRYLGEKGVVHRDVRACNVLVQKDLQTGRPLVAKLADFGLAKYIGKSGIYKLTGQTTVPALYTAPEGFRFDGSITVQADVWSFGVFMWELYMLMSEELATNPGDPGPPPYWQLQADHDIFVEVVNGRRLESPSTAPSEAYSIMNRCWLYKPEARPTFEQLISELEILRDLKPPPPQETQAPNEVEPPHYARWVPS